ncbi:MAG TPA: alpha/beta fold hydrolase [Candidatus Limnocylindria bacterium]|nr:alpha/beta fold hydrolase [Candidatus Limnocylindria bacterium]
MDGRAMSFDKRGIGPPLVLVAGTGYPGATWDDDLVGPLAERHTVVTFDHRGTGASAPTPDRYSTRLFARDALGLMDALDLAPAHVLGHSMGGRVAQWMALDRPERIRSLILAATGPGQFREDQPVTRGVPVRVAVEIAEHGYERYMHDHVRETFFTPEFAEAHPERVERLHRLFWEHRPTLEEYLRHVVARQEHQTADRLGDIAVPALVLVGDRDTVRMGTGSHWEQSMYLVEHLPNAELRVIPGAAHGYFWQVPGETVRAILEWTARYGL